VVTYYRYNHGGNRCKFTSVFVFITKIGFLCIYRKLLIINITFIKLKSSYLTVVVKLFIMIFVLVLQNGWVNTMYLLYTVSWVIKLSSMSTTSQSEHFIQYIQCSDRTILENQTRTRTFYALIDRFLSIEYNLMLKSCMAIMSGVILSKLQLILPQFLKQKNLFVISD
jgi:hypothetical protein